MKLKQIIVGTMMGLALVLCTDAEAAGCAKNQWLNGKNVRRVPQMQNVKLETRCLFATRAIRTKMVRNV